MIVQEIGHNTDIWPHSDDPDNIMSNGAGARNQLRHLQCGLLRTSRFSRVTPFFPVIDVADWTNEAARTGLPVSGAGRQPSRRSPPLGMKVSFC